MIASGSVVCICRCQFPFCRHCTITHPNSLDLHLPPIYQRKKKTQNTLSGIATKHSLHSVSGNDVRTKPNKKEMVHYEQDIQTAFGSHTRRSDTLHHGDGRSAWRQRPRPKTRTKAPCAKASSRASAETSRSSSSRKAPPQQRLGNARCGCRRRSCRYVPVTGKAPKHSPAGFTDPR